MLQRMPAAIRATFTATQIKAIETALIPRSHKLDIRLWLPFLGQGAYLVLLAGPNHRTNTRPASEQTAAAMGGVFSSVVNMSQSIRSYPNAYHLLNRMSKEASATFTLVQIQAIEKALIPRAHVVDIRLSLPLLGKGAYLVFAAGPDRRAQYRDLQNGNPFVAPAVFISVAISVMAILGLVHLKSSELLAAPDPVFERGAAFYPTTVPS